MGWKEIDWKAVGRFMILAAPFTVLGAFGFAKVPKGPMTVVLCSFLIVFAIMKLRGKMHHSYSGNNTKDLTIRGNAEPTRIPTDSSVSISPRAPTSRTSHRSSSKKWSAN